MKRKYTQVAQQLDYYKLNYSLHLQEMDNTDIHSRLAELQNAIKDLMHCTRVHVARTQALTRHQMLEEEKRESNRQAKSLA